MFTLDPMLVMAGAGTGLLVGLTGVGGGTRQPQPFLRKALSGILLFTGYKLFSVAA